MSENIRVTFGGVRAGKTHALAIRREAEERSRASETAPPRHTIDPRAGIGMRKGA